MVKRYIDVFFEKDANIILEITKINGYMPPKKKKKNQILSTPNRRKSLTKTDQGNMRWV